VGLVYLLSVYVLLRTAVHSPISIPYSFILFFSPKCTLLYAQKYGRCVVHFRGTFFFLIKKEEGFSLAFIGIPGGDILAR